MSDILGDEGRKAVNACVKVAIFGTPEPRTRYSRKNALTRLWNCYAGELPNPTLGKDLDPVLLPERENDGQKKKNYNIKDIYEALNNFDRMEFVQKYRKDGKGSEEINKRRDDVLIENQEVCDGKIATRYSVHVAQRRIRDCYAGNFPGDIDTLDSKEDDEEDPEDDKLPVYSIFDIHDALLRCDKCGITEYPAEELIEAGITYSNELRSAIKDQREGVEKEYEETIRNSLGQKTIIRYSAKKAQHRVTKCYKSIKKSKVKFPREGQKKNRLYTIFDIREHCVHYEALYHIKVKQITDTRKDVEKEYQKAVSSCRRQRYSRDEAECRVRDCFVGIKGDEDILPIEGNPRKDIYEISDINAALDYYDNKKFVYLKDPELQMKSEERIQRISEVKKCRDAIEEEYKKATSDELEIDHGSGFIIQDHFIITNEHVVQASASGKKVYIYNQAIDPKLHCEVIYSKAATCIDLALLYCKDLKVDEIKPNIGKITRLQLSDKELLQGTSIFSFGYPFFHTGRKALLVNGSVSGFSEPYGQGEISPLVVLNCPVSHGNSGGPLLNRDNNEVKVVGVVSKKQTKDILTPDERKTIEKIKESLQTSDITDLKHTRGAEEVRKKGERPDPCQTPLNVLTLKLYDALETHCQFVSSKAIPQDTVCKFLKDAAIDYNGPDKEELALFAGP